MSKNKYSDLLQKTEKLLKEKGLNKSDSFYTDIESLLEELNIHQIELEMQNQELLEANQKLENEQKKYKDLYLEAPLAYFTLNKTGNIIDINQAATDMMILPNQSFKYTSIFPYINDNYKIDFTNFLKKSFETDEKQYIDISLKNSEHKTIYGHLTAIKFKDTELDEFLIRCSVVDLTKTKQYEKELFLQKKITKSEKRFRELFENSGEIMLLIDPETQKIEDANKAATNFYGYTIDEIKKLKISDINILPNEDIKSKIENVKTNGKNNYLLEHKLKSGEIKYVEVFSTAVEFDNTVKLFSIIHDITERKIAQEKIERLNAQLSNTIEELKTANEEINSSNEELNRINKIISTERKQFLSILDSIPENIYVADMNTHEILFANKKMKEEIGKDVTGELCYKGIRNENKECDYCSNKYIKNNNESYLWEKYNSALDKHFYLIDRKIKWTNQKEVKFQLAIDITKQKKAELQNKKLSVAVEQSPASIVITDSSGNIEYVNNTFCQKTGYSKEEAIGQNPRILKSGKTPPEVYENLWKTISSGKVWKGEYINKKKNGEEYIEAAIISPILNKIGNVINYLAIKEDISDRRKAEQALKENEWLLTQVGDLAKVGGWKIDVATQKLSWTTEVFHIHEKDDMKQPTVEQAISYYDEKSLPIIQKAVGQAIENGKPFDLQLKIITEKGNKKQVRAIGRLQADITNKTNQLIGVFQDITEIKQREKEIIEINKKYKQLFDFMPVGISLADNKGQLIENNKVAERILGLNQEEHNHRTIDADEWKIINKSGEIMKSDEFASVRALKENKLIENVQMGIVKGKDKTTWLNVSAIPSINGEGLIISYIDISENIQREKQLEKYTNKLKEANATKDKFFGIIAHDLKNPFNAIIGFSDILVNFMDGFEKEKIKTFVESIYTTSKSTYKLLENLLEWSRTQTGKIQFNPEPLVIENIVISTIEQLQGIAESKNISLKYQIKESIIVKADENMLNTILRNLITNSIKYTNESGKITVIVEQNEKEVLFSVKDTGIGMNEDTISKLFKIEEKISRPGTNNEKGTGLGLLLCKEFVEKHDGTIQVESQVDVGTTFIFNIPKN